MTTPETFPWLPTADDVAALLRARTKDSTGRELGTWSDDTRPSTTEVESIIVLASRQTIGTTYDGGPCDALVAAATCYRAACIVELSYFPEQVRSDRSPYDELKQLLDETIVSLRECQASGGGNGSGTTGEGYTYHSLPLVPETLARYYANGGWGWRNPEDPATWRQPCFAPTPANPARIDEHEPPPEPLHPIIIGHPAEGDVELGLPPIITGEQTP